MDYVTDTKLIMLYSEAPAFPVISEFQSLIHVLFWINNMTDENQIHNYTFRSIHKLI
jgi:hypothetical protein